MKLTLEQIDQMDHLAEETMKIRLHWGAKHNDWPLKDNEHAFLAINSYSIALAMMRARDDCVEKVS